jgi:hypothetical protein
MTDTTRLESISRALSDAFRGASPEAKRAAAREASEVAVQNAGIVTPDTDAALAALRVGRGVPDPALGRRLEELAARLDDEYLELGESPSEADKRRSLALFTQARAASALACAMCGPAPPR